MSDDHRPRPFSSGLAVVLAALATLSLAVATRPRAVAVVVGGLLGVAVLTLGARTVTRLDATNATDAWGSVGVVLGVVGVSIAVVTVGFGAAGPAVALVGAALIGLASAGGVDADTDFQSVCWRNRDVFALGALAAVTVDIGAPSLAARGVDGVVGIVRSGVLGSVAALSVLVALASVVLPRAQTAIGATRERSVVVTESERTGRAFWVATVATAILGVVAPGLLDPLVAALPGIGPLVQVVLYSGLLHVVAAAVLAYGVVVLCLGVVHDVAVSTTSIRPARAIARAGGAIAALLGLGVARQVGGVLSETDTTGVLLWLLGLTVVFLLLPAVWITLSALLSTVLPSGSRSAGGVAGALLIGAGAVVAPGGGAGPVTVVAVVASAVVIYDLSDHAVALGRRVDASVDTRTSEVFHAASSLLIAAGGTGVALAVTYGLGYLSLSPSGSQGKFAVVLALLAVLAFVVALTRDQLNASSSPDS